MEATTILSIRKNKSVVMIGDGQVTLGNTVMKSNARKVKKTYHDKVLAGFAGATADAFTLFERMVVASILIGLFVFINILVFFD